MPNIFTVRNDVPDDNTNGYDAETNTGVYLENNSNSRGIGYVRIYQPDAGVDINDTQVPISSAAPDARWSQLLSDVLSLDYLIPELRNNDNLIFSGVNSNEPLNVGTYFQIILADYQQGIGGHFNLSFDGNAGYTTDANGTYVKNLNRGHSPGTSPVSTQNQFDILQYDARIVLNTQIAIDPAFWSRNNIVEPTRLGQITTNGIDQNGNVRQINAGIYDILNVPNEYYQSIGFNSANGYAMVTAAHELFHSFESTALGGILSGHGSIIAGVLSAPAGTAFSGITGAMVTANYVEGKAYNYGVAIGAISNESDGSTNSIWLSKRVQAYNAILKNAAAAAGVPFPTTAGEVQFLRNNGFLKARSSSLYLGLEGDEPIIKQDWIVTGAADWGLVGISAAGALGSSFGRRLFGDNRLAGSVSGAVLGELTKQVAAEALSAIGNGSVTVEHVANRTFEDLGIDIAGAGAGAITSYLVGEVFSELGVNGFAGEALNSAASFGLSTIASNLTQRALGVTVNGELIKWNNSLTGANFGNFAGSFLGSKLASLVKTFDSVGGQIGFSVGGAAGAALAASVFAKSTAIVANFLAPGVGAFVGALLGGVIGSLFGGGTPESGAHVVWDATNQTFTTGTSWADDWGGSAANNAARDRAIDVATTAGDVLNRVVDGLGESASAYQNPTAIGAGAYGQRKDKWLYWGAGENSRTHALSGEYDEALQAINHGLSVAFDNVTLQGGDIYLKRALYKNLETNQNRANFDFSGLIGDLSIGADLSFYHENKALIDGAIALAPESALAQGWVLTLLRAGELNLDQHYKSDFYGGLQGYLSGSGFLRDTGLSLAEIEVTLNPKGDLVISDGALLLPSGSATVNGWYTGFAPEARWAAVAGPNGDTVTAMETGQLNTGSSGGGTAYTNSFDIDETKTYEYTIYVQKHDLTKSHRLYLGAAGGTVVDAVSGTSNTNPYFYHTVSGLAQDDRWYKIVGYILPEGDRLTSHADKGGVYDTVTGEKISNVTNFAWDPNRTRSTGNLRFFSYYGQAHQGLSTYWSEPSVRVVGENSVGANLVDLSGWPADPTNADVIPDFAETAGYTTPITTTTNRTGTIYSDIIIASGSGNINIVDNASATAANGPGINGNSRLSDDIFIGNSGNNQLWGYAGWDWLQGGGGVDKLVGGDGNDFLSGGDGNDYVASGATGNVAGGLYGGNGDDILVGGQGQDALYGDSGDDLLLVDQDSNFDYLHGGIGSDTVSFENFNLAVNVDMRTGTTASYTAVTYGDGWVSIENLTGSKFSDTLQGNNSANVLTGLSGDDTINGHGGNDTIIGGAGADVINGGSGSDTVSYRKSSRGVQISLQDGTAKGGDAQGDQISAIENIEGSDQADILQGSSATGQLFGLDGSDIFLASAGATQFVGGEGIDTVDYSSSTAGVNARLDLGTGSAGYASGDSYESVEQLIGSGFNDVLYGTSESDRLQGGAGSDYLYGQLGDDSYAFTAGSGLDRITDSGGYHDYIIVDGNISLNDLQMSRSGSTLVLQQLGSSDQIYVNSHFATIENKIDKLAWENGSQVFINHITNFYNGSTAGNTIYGGGGTHDFIHGHSGNDTLHGFGGLDILIGGAGNDTLYGGDHRDYYVFGRGSGLDTIIDTAGSDVLVMADDISASDLLIDYQGNDLYIGLKVPGNANVTAFNAPDRVVVKNQLLGASAIEGLQLGDQYVSLPKLAGQATGSNNAPQILTSVLNRYAPFYGGTVGYVGSYDAEGDSLTFTVNSYSNDLGLPGNYYFVSSTNQLYSSTYWNQQNQSTTTLNISVADGTNTTTDNLSVNWLPDPNGGPLWPIVLDLDGDGVELVQPNKSKIKWDVNEDGYIDKIGWAGPDDAFLAIDRDGSGLIEGVDEISFINDLEGATTDLEGLRGFDFDANGVTDGKIDENDVFYSDFRIWQDINQDGLSEASELKTLAEAGIESIGLAGTPTGEEVTNIKRNTILNTGTFTKTDGSEGTFGDVALGVKHGKPKGKNGHDDTQITIGSFDKFFANKGKVNERTREDGADDGGGRLAPIILDLDVNGVNLISIAESNVEFDADSDGVKEWTGWVSSGDGILVRDLDGDGAITRGEEMSFTQYLEGAETDLQGLRAFDSNSDGLITAADQDWQSFGVWIDANSDGISQSDELISLNDAEVGQILLTANTVDLESGGNVIHQFGEFIKTDGSRVALADVALGYLELEENVETVSETLVDRIPISADRNIRDLIDDDTIWADMPVVENGRYSGFSFHNRRSNSRISSVQGDTLQNGSAVVGSRANVAIEQASIDSRVHRMIDAMNMAFPDHGMNESQLRHRSYSEPEMWAVSAF